MEQRYATSSEQVPGMDTAELRKRYLIQDLFVDDEVNAIYTHHDRIVLVGVSPVTKALDLPSFPQIRSSFFFEHREGGIVNVGGAGTVTVDGTQYLLAKGSCLYVGRGARVVVVASFEAAGEQGAAHFYMLSAPAHTAYPTTLVQAGQGNVRELGDPLTSNRRTLNQYIHEKGIQSCQVVMGVTQLHPGSRWNTMPAHPHPRPSHGGIPVFRRPARGEDNPPHGGTSRDPAHRRRQPGGRHLPELVGALGCRLGELQLRVGDGR
jgi:4-deoxy-L-threo-5-hexosulose-uronate ketol-isomerase